MEPYGFMLRRNTKVGVYNLALIVKGVSSRKYASERFLLHDAPVSTEMAPPAGSRFYTTRRSPLVSTGIERVQTEPRIQAGTSAAPRGRLSQ